MSIIKVENNNNIGNEYHDSKTGQFASLTHYGFSKKWVDDILYEYASPTVDDYSRAYLSRIPIQKFLELTSIFPQRIMDESDIFDEDRYNSEIRTPWLEVDMKTGKVMGHEGRHRLAGMLKSGYNSADIVIRPYRQTDDEKYDMQDVSSIDLTGQEFGGHNANGKYKMNNLIAAKSGNKDLINRIFLDKEDYQVPEHQLFVSKREEDPFEEEEDYDEAYNDVYESSGLDFGDEEDPYDNYVLDDIDELTDEDIFGFDDLDDEDENDPFYNNNK